MSMRWTGKGSQDEGRGETCSRLDLDSHCVTVSAVRSSVGEQDLSLSNGGRVNVVQLGRVSRVVAGLDIGVRRVRGDLSGLVGGKVGDELGCVGLPKEGLCEEVERSVRIDTDNSKRAGESVR
jgi:hypothetical protein